MPRIYNFVKSINRHEPEALLDVMRGGLGEIGEEQVAQEQEIPGCQGWRKAQFNVGLSSPGPLPFMSEDDPERQRIYDKVGEFQAEMDQVFQWLGDHMTCPWHWNESYGPNSGRLDIAVYIERQPDQKLFHATWGHRFDYEPKSSEDLERLGVIKGILPFREDVFQWISRHHGFSCDYDDSDPDLKIFKFEIPEIESAFQRDWVDKGFFKHDEVNGFYVGKVPDFRKLYKWLDTYSAFHVDLNRNIQGATKLPIFIVPRYEIAAQKFREVWGSTFQEVLIGDSGAVILAHAPGLRIEFFGEHQERSPQSIPEDFMSYLRGECDFSVVNAPYNNLQIGSAFVIDRASPSVSSYELDYVT